MPKAKKLPSGAYRVRVYMGKSADGKQIMKSFTAPTKKEAELLAAQFSQLHIDVNRSEQTLGEAVKRYISSKENILSPSTVRGYGIIYRNAVPELMGTLIKDITQERVQLAFNDYAKNHSPKTCRNAHGLITAVLAAERPELNLKTTLPKKRKRDIYVPEKSEIVRIYGRLKGGDLEIPFLLAAECGLRASEIAALKTENVHKSYISIKEALVTGVGDEPSLKGPKSATSFWRVPISGKMYKLLAERSENGAICKLTSDKITKKWINFRKKEQLSNGFVFHALRHPYVKYKTKNIFENLMKFFAPAQEQIKGTCGVYIQSQFCYQGKHRLSL